MLFQRKRNLRLLRLKQNNFNLWGTPEASPPRRREMKEKIVFRKFNTYGIYLISLTTFGTMIYSLGQLI